MTAHTSKDFEQELRTLRERYATLSRREREVMALVVSGLLNKQVGGRLCISEVTVKLHRGSATRKMGENSLPELVYMATALGVAWPRRIAEGSSAAADPSMEDRKFSPGLSLQALRALFQEDQRSRTTSISCADCGSAPIGKLVCRSREFALSAESV